MRTIMTCSALMLGWISVAAAAGVAPCVELTCPADPATVERVLATAAERDWIDVVEIARSAGGRPLSAVHAARADGSVTSWRVLLIGQQHGDEPAGKDALLHLVHRISEDPELVPPGVDLWIVPVANPDGAAAGRRRNDADADLNRDHLLLSQPETRALHQLARDLRPHLVVDCHEFDRTSADYRERGWSEWPLIMMDTANHPLLPDDLYRAGLAWVEAATEPMTAAGFPYQRYSVGGVPPDGELRPSTLEADDARNGLAMAAGSLGFIIESGIRRAADDPQGDIARRVAATLELLSRFVEPGDLRDRTVAAVDAARNQSTIDFLPVNTFWGCSGLKPTKVPVVDAATGATVEVATANVMDDRIIKRTVAAPVGYAVDAADAKLYRPLLARHGLEAEMLPVARTLAVERCTLERVEASYDELYNRYEGRQIVRCSAASGRDFAAGSLLVRLDRPDWRSAVVVLEPMELYGLYQYDELRATVAEDGTIPVFRLMEQAAGD